MTTAEYLELLKDPRWQKKRLEIFQRDLWMCAVCHDTQSTLAVHHRLYLPNRLPWDYPDNLLITLCESCHVREGAERTDVERHLIEILRANFLYPEVAEMAHAFDNMLPGYNPTDMASMVSYILTDEQAFKQAGSSQNDAYLRRTFPPEVAAELIAAYHKVER